MARINSRSKGQRGEREIVKLLQEIVDDVCISKGVETIRIERNQNQSVAGGYDLIGLQWLAPEVKFCETLSVEKWWVQCLRQTKKGQKPVLFYRKSRMSWTIRTFLYSDLGHEIPAEISCLNFEMLFRSWCEKYIN